MRQSSSRRADAPTSSREVPSLRVKPLFPLSYVGVDVQPASPQSPERARPGQSRGYRPDPGRTELAVRPPASCRQASGPSPTSSGRASRRFARGQTAISFLAKLTPDALALPHELLDAVTIGRSSPAAVTVAAPLATAVTTPPRPNRRTLGFRVTPACASRRVLGRAVVVSADEHQPKPVSDADALLIREDRE